MTSQKMWKLRHPKNYEDTIENGVKLVNLITFNRAGSSPNILVIDRSGKAHLLSLEHARDRWNQLIAIGWVRIP